MCSFNELYTFVFRTCWSYDVKVDKFYSSYTNTNRSSLWQKDITYIQLTNHGWVYLATVLDSEQGKVLDYKIGDTMTIELVTSALQMALDIETKATNSSFGYGVTIHKC